MNILDHTSEPSSPIGEQPSSISSYLYMIVTICVMTIPGLAANTLSFYCIIPDLKRKKTLVKQLLLALCVTDFCGCVGVFELHIVILFPNIPKSACYVTSFVTVYFPMLSGVIATFMACERCLALGAPYWYQWNMFNWKLWAPFFCIVFIVTVVCLFPQVGLGDVVYYSVIENKTVATCGSFHKHSGKNVKESLFIITYAVTGLVLTVANLSLNITVLRILHKMKMRVHDVYRRKDVYHEFEMTKLLLALSLTYLICWTPLNVQLLLRHAGSNTLPAVGLLVKILVGLNFVIDPLIHLFMKKNYRNKIRLLVCWKRDTDQRPIRALRQTTLSSVTQEVFYCKKTEGTHPPTQRLPPTPLGAVPQGNH